MTTVKTLRVIIDAAVREIVTLVRVAGRLDPATIERVYKAVERAIGEARALERGERYAPFVPEAEEDKTPTEPGYRYPRR